MDLKIALILFWSTITFTYVALAIIALKYRFKHKIDGINLRKSGGTYTKELAESIESYSDNIAKVNSIGFLIAGIAAIATVITLALA